MAEEKVKYRVEDSIAYVIINNPQKMNILDFDVYDGLFTAFESIEEDDNVSVAILSGTGDKAFICGQDIATFRVSSPKEVRKFLRKTLKMFTDLESISKPVIAAVNGLALGGGTEILLACDMVVASEKARFGLPESGIGVAPIWGLIRLSDAVGRKKAKELMMTGDIIAADEALNIGLINKVVPHDEVMQSSVEMARKITGKAPFAIELIKSAIDRKLLPDGAAYTIEGSKYFFTTEDLKEGVDAFLNKRNPTFKGV